MAHQPETVEERERLVGESTWLASLQKLRHANYRRRRRVWFEAGIDRGAALPANLADSEAAAHRLAEIAGEVEAEAALIEKNLEGELFPFREQAHRLDLRLAARHRVAI